MHIFLDESGNFTKHDDGQYFVVGTFTVGEQRRTDKKMRAWFRKKFPKKMRGQNEIKWSQSGISDELRLRTIKKIAKLDVRIRYGFLLRTNIPVDFRRKGKIESGLLYMHIIGEILKRYLPIDEKEIHIFCDKRQLKGITKQEFELAIKNQMMTLCSPGTLVHVEMIDSATNGNMQIADWIAGAMARHLEKGRLGEECYKNLKNNFLDAGIEFFATQ